MPNNDAINALTEPTTTSFTITVSDGALSAAEEFTIAIHGTNDAAVISGNTSGEAVEAGGLANTAALGPLTATGTLTAADVDNAPNTFTPVTTPTASTGGYGTFMITAAGVWAYTVNEVQRHAALNVGDTLTDSFTVTSVTAPATGDDHHPRRQRRCHHPRYDDRIGDRRRHRAVRRSDGHRQADR